MARGLWAAFSIVVGVIAFAVALSSEAVLTRLIATLAGLAPGALQLGVYGALGLAIIAFAAVIFLFLILVPELTEIARLDGVLRALRALRPVHDGSPVQLLRALAGSPPLAGLAAALRPGLRVEDQPGRSESILASPAASDIGPAFAGLAAPPPRLYFFRAVLALLALFGATLALLNTALPRTMIAHADGAIAASIGTAALLALPLAAAIVLWAGQTILRAIMLTQLRQVLDELRALVSAPTASTDAAAQEKQRVDLAGLQQGFADIVGAALRRIEAIKPPPVPDFAGQLGELPQIATALVALREELTATVQVARDATKLLFSSAQHIEDIANLMRESGGRPIVATQEAAAAPLVAPSPDLDDATNDLRRAIGELLAETTAQAARLPKV